MEFGKEIRCLDREVQSIYASIFTILCIALYTLEFVFLLNPNSTVGITMEGITVPNRHLFLRRI